MDDEGLGQTRESVERRRRARTQALAARRRRTRVGAAIAVLLVMASAAGYAVARSGLLGARDVDPLPAIVATSTPAATATVEPTATAAATATAEPPLASRVIEIGWVGDTTPGSKYGNPPDEGRALFVNARDLLLEPDIMIANLEGTFGVGGASKCDGRDSSACYAFQAPPENAAALAWAGIDVVNLANNHSHDYLAAGLASTRETLETNDIAYTGLVDTVAIQEVDGVTVAVLGFSPYSWSPNIGDLDAARALVRSVDEQADVIVVVMHAGAEGADKTHTPEGPETAYGEFRGDSRAFSHAVIDAGADLVIGSGPHVIRGVEEYGGRIVAYSLANFAGWNNFSRAGNLALSGLLTVQISGDGRVLGGTWHSLRLEGAGVPTPDPGNASLALVRSLSAEDFATPVTFQDDGSFVLQAE